MSESSTMPKSNHIGAYLDVLLKANTKIAEEMRMNEAKAFYEMLERTGVVADFEARGEARGEAKAAEIIKEQAAALSKKDSEIAELRARLANYM
ncbi:MAG: hypothetical protein Ta2F_12140 [Termitinemataceae bacterium]|nr:MAG: hypothetical protein Ta2F_10530 [Termitinemataceae bacterium]GMO36217.1 MAG: hypothetical protein Ta2F_12140 [Termitinemataceae bacterium]